MWFAINPRRKLSIADTMGQIIDIRYAFFANLIVAVLSGEFCCEEMKETEKFKLVDESTER